MTAALDWLAVRMNRATELEHLRKADADIADGLKRVERQQELIARLQAQGHDVTTAKTLLATMQETLAAMEQHRLAIVQELKAQEKP